MQNSASSTPCPSFKGTFEPPFLHSGRASSLTIAEGVAPNDKDLSQDPSLSLSKTRKWIITIVACLFTLIVSCAVTSYTMGITSMMRDLGCTRPQAIAGLTAYVLAFGIFPLLTSAFSEELGRNPLYVVSMVVFLAMHVGIALYGLVLLFAFVQGAVGSAGATMVAGTIADLWAPHERGLPMSIYSIVAFGGNGAGTIMGGWIEMNSRLGWKWIQWTSLIFGGVLTVIFTMVMQETRSTVVARKWAKAQSKQKELEGKKFTYILPPQIDLKQLIWVSATRPLTLFFTEPIIFAVSIWIGFAWGVFYCMIATVPAVFGELHGFNLGQVGTVNVAMFIGAFIGWLTNIYQERLYHANVGKRHVEARLYTCCAAGVVFPLSMFMFAWFCRSDIHWIALVISLTVYLWAMFTIYLAVFSYLADCYDIYASSALAGQSLARNLIGGIFPLFTGPMFKALGYSWANTVFAFVALAMIPIPFTIFFWGSKIRARSSRCVKDDEPSTPALNE